jgi:hypothetical protein
MDESYSNYLVAGKSVVERIVGESAVAIAGFSLLAAKRMTPVKPIVPGFEARS